MLSCLVTKAQMVIGGRALCLDTVTNTLFATVPENMFGHDAMLQVVKDQGWQQVDIDGTDIINGTFLFSGISAERKWAVTATKADSTQLNATLQFTFLPIVQLLPAEGDSQFSNEYQRGMVLFSHPDSATTDTLTARIKWRGGTTNAANKHKRNYKLNFDEDHRFFGLRNDDKWMLDAGQPDVFRLRNRIAMDLWNKMARKPFYADQEPKALNGVRGDIVELFLGNEWRGIYNLSEFIDRKQLKLKKIDDKTGIIRGCLYKGISWNKTKMFDIFDSYDNSKDTFFGYEFKYPELGDDSDTIDWAPLIAANNFARNSTDEEFQQQVDDYFDIPVLIDYNIFFNVVNAVDNVGKNMYWAVYDKTADQRLTPTPWDLDATFGQRWGGLLIGEIEEGFYNSPEFKLDFELMLTYRMFRDNFNDYLGKLNERYRYLRQPGQPLHTDSILALVSRYYQAVKNSGAAQREEAKWSGDSDVWGDVIDFDTEYAYVCDWIKRRMVFIDETELPLFYKKSYFDELDIQSPTPSPTKDHDNIYDLSGRIVANGTVNGLRPGLYIRDGRRIIVSR
ncbi:MAG: CotH kinase family protein [Prevotella sp.]|nr:CotH kinase family protein [Prevotella sp.]